MISVCIELDFEDQLDTDTLICKVFIKKSVREESLTTYAQGLHQEISERRITKEDKESEFGSLCIYAQPRTSGSLKNLMTFSYVFNIQLFFGKNSTYNFYSSICSTNN
ncbi:hypothetical protein YC2023_109999 [Brassica napus]